MRMRVAGVARYKLGFACSPVIKYKMVGVGPGSVSKSESEKLHLHRNKTDVQTTDRLKLSKTNRGTNTSKSKRNWDKSVKTLYVKKKFNVLMVADQIKNDEYDRRFVDTCIVLCQEGHNVTILSTRIMTTQCFEIRHYCRKIYEVGRWLPRDVCGMARSLCFYIRTAYLALWAYLYMQPKPDLIFCNCVNMRALKLFRWIKNSKLLTFFQVFNFNQMPRASSEYLIQPKNKKKKDVLYIDEVLCSNALTKCVFRYMYNAKDLPITILYPTVRRPLVVSIDCSPPLYIPDRAYIFLSFYNLVPSSRFDVAIKAFGIMYGSLEDAIRNKCYLILIGHYRKSRANDNYLQMLKNQILSMNMQDRIFIMNNVQHSYMRMLMSMSHAYIHAQSYSVCEDNIIEAMAAGRPVIATNTGFPCEVIKHKLTGYLLPLDADLFADAMIDLLVRPEKYRTMASRIQSIYEENFGYSYFIKSVNRIVSKYDEHLRQDEQYRSSQPEHVAELNDALAEIHRYNTSLPIINVLATHQELITDKFYAKERFYGDSVAVAEDVKQISSHMLRYYL